MRSEGELYWITTIYIYIYIYNENQIGKEGNMQRLKKYSKL